jgi:hypothetical protein
MQVQITKQQYNQLPVQTKWTNTQSIAWAIVPRELNIMRCKLGLDTNSSAIDYARDMALDAIVEGITIPDNHKSPMGFLTIYIRNVIKKALGIRDKDTDKSINPLDESLIPKNLANSMGVIGNGKARIGMTFKSSDEWQNELAKSIAYNKQLWDHKKISRMFDSQNRLAKKLYDKVNRKKLSAQRKLQRQKRKEIVEQIFACDNGDMILI